MNQKPETVRVVATDVASQGAFVVMNRADFNPDTHRLFVEGVGEEEKPRRGRPPKLKPQEAPNGNR